MGTEDGRVAILASLVLVVMAGLLFLLFGSDLVGPPGDGPPERPDIEGPLETTPDPETASPPPGANRVRVHLGRGPGTVEGRVWRGNAPGTATVTIFPFAYPKLEAPGPKPEAIARIETDERGWFRCSGLPRGSYELRVRDEAGLRGRGRVNIHRAQTTHVDIRLDGPGVTLTGRACFADGRPFAGLAILGLLSVATDAEGRFRFEDLAPGKHRLHLMVPGRLRLDRDVVLPRPDELTWIVDEGMVAVRGRVVAADDESPVAGARVVGKAWQQCEVVTTTDATGGFALGLPGRASITVSATGFAPLRSRFGGEGDLLLRLLRGARIRGRVLARENGRPLPGLGVHVMTSRAFGYVGDAPTVVSGEDGTFELTDLPAGDVTVIARGRGWISEGAAVWTMPKEDRLAVETEVGRVTTRDLYVVRTGRIEGTVTGSDGAVVAEAGVQARPQERWLHGLALETVANADGTYVLADVTPGIPYVVRIAGADGVLSKHPEPVTVRSGATLRVDLRLPVPRWVRLEILDAESGAPVVGADLIVTQDSRRLRCRTDETGAARLGPLGPDEAKVRVEHDLYLCPSKATVLPPDGPESVTLRVAPGLPLAGRVVPPADMEGFRATIAVQGAGKKLRGFNSRRRAEVGPDGGFELGPFPAGTYEVVVHAAKPVAFKSPPFSCVAGREDHVLVLPPPAGEGPSEEPPALLVRCIGPDGRKVFGGVVSVLDADRPGRWLGGDALDEGGDATPIEVYGAPERVILLVSGAKSATGARLGAVRHGPIPLAAGKVTIELPVGKVIAGRVVDERGRGLADVRVAARLVGQRGSRSPFESRTDGQGRFEIAGLGDLDALLAVESPRDRIRLNERKVRGGTKDVLITLKAATSLAVHVRNPDGQPVEMAYVTAIPVGGGSPDVSVRTGKTGRTTIPHLEPGAAYDIRVMAGPRGIWEADSKEPRLARLMSNVVVGADDLTVRLEEGLTIRGRILGTKRAEVHAFLPGVTVATWMAEDGSFEVRGLTPEIWKVVVFAVGLKGPPPTREVRAGGTVEFDLRPK